MKRLLKIIGASGLLVLLLPGCVVEQRTLPLQVRSAAPEIPSQRIHLDSSLPDSLLQGRLSGERMEAQRQRLEKIAREHLGVEADSRYDIRAAQILFEPADRQRLLLEERFEELPIEATPVLMEIEKGKVIRQEGHLHRPPDDFSTKPTIDQVSAEELARIYVSSLPNAPATSERVIRFDIESALPRLVWRIDLPGQRVWIDATSGNMIAQEPRTPMDTQTVSPPEPVQRPQRIAK